MTPWNGYRYCAGRGPSPIDTARRAFHLLVSGPHPLTVDCAMFPGLPPKPMPLDELQELLLSTRTSPATRDAVWAHLVRRARVDGAAWTVGCVGMAAPGLIADAARLVSRFAGDPDDIDAAVLAGFLAALATVDLSQPWIVQRLRMAARAAGKAALRDALSAPIPTKSPFLSRQPQPPSHHPDLVLARAVAEKVLTPPQAELIGTTRLEKVSLRAYAENRRISYEAVRKVRARAERKLIAYLTAQATDSCDPDDRPWPSGRIPRSPRLQRHRPAKRDRSPTATGRQPGQSRKSRHCVSQNRHTAPNSEMRRTTARPARSSDDFDRLRSR